MKHLFTLFILSITALFAAQNAEEIVRKNIEATGGYKAWNQLHSIVLSGTIELGDKTYPIKIYQKRPNKTLSVIQLNGKNFILEAYDGGTAYRNNFSTGKLENIYDYVAESFDSDLLLYKNKGFNVDYKGKVNVTGIPCYEVALQKNKNSTYYYFSTQYNYLIQEKTRDEILLYDNFKKLDKWVFPYYIESLNYNGETNFVIKIKSIETNKVLNDSLFRR